MKELTEEQMNEMWKKHTNLWETIKHIYACGNEDKYEIFVEEIVDEIVEESIDEA